MVVVPAGVDAVVDVAVDPTAGVTAGIVVVPAVAAVVAATPVASVVVVVANPDVVGDLRVPGTVAVVDPPKPAPLVGFLAAWAFVYSSCRFAM